MLNGDEQATAAKQADELNDPRVTQVWDPERAMGELTATTLGLSSTAWDVYLVYPAGVTWDADEPPSPAFWMHQLPSETGADQSLRLDPDALSRAVERAIGLEGVPRT
jgi:hypothetical protein